jgi:hypothetical protein
MASNVVGFLINQISVQVFVLHPLMIKDKSHTRRTVHSPRNRHRLGLGFRGLRLSVNYQEENRCIDNSLLQQVGATNARFVRTQQADAKKEGERC